MYYFTNYIVSPYLTFNKKLTPFRENLLVELKNGMTT